MGGGSVVINRECRGARVTMARVFLRLGGCAHVRGRASSTSKMRMRVFKTGHTPPLFLRTTCTTPRNSVLASIRGGKTCTGQGPGAPGKGTSPPGWPGGYTAGPGSQSGGGAGEEERRKGEEVHERRRGGEEAQERRQGGECQTPRPGYHGEQQRLGLILGYPGTVLRWPGGRVTSLATTVLGIR